MRLLPIGLLAALVWEPGPVVAQATGDKGQIEGRVTAASDTSAAAAGAEIELVGTGLRQYTDAGGWYRFTTVPIGSHALRARMLGYQSLTWRVDVIAGLPSRHDIVLRRLPQGPSSAQTLGKIDVTAKESASRFADFDRRRITGGGGIFLTDSLIQTGGHVRLTDLFRRFPSIEVIDSSGIKLVTSRRMLKPMVEYGKDFNLVPCVFQVVVDDVPMPWGFDMDLLQRSEIHGIEVYSGPATIPVEYRSTRRDANCGMIAIWTRSR